MQLLSMDCRETCLWCGRGDDSGRGGCDKYLGKVNLILTCVAHLSQSYVDDQLVNTGFVSKAAITGLDGSMWASSAGFQVYLMAFVLTCTVNRWGRGWSDGRSVSRLPPIPASPFTLPVGMILSAGWDASLVAQAPAVHSVRSQFFLCEVVGHLCPLLTCAPTHVTTLRLLLGGVRRRMLCTVVVQWIALKRFFQVSSSSTCLCGLVLFLSLAGGKSFHTTQERFFASLM